MPHNFHNVLFHHRFHFTELREIYLMHSIRGLANSLFVIFIPIYFYRIGYSLTVVGLFFLFINILRILLPLFAGFVISRLGAKRTMQVSVMPAIISTIAIASAMHGYWVLFIAALFWSIEVSLFWPANHANLSYIRDRNKTSSESGTIFILLTIAYALGPLIGGTIASYSDIRYVYIIAIIAMLTAMYPLSKTAEQMPRKKFKLSHVKQMWRRITPHLFANTGGSFQAQAVSYAWPLFIYFLLESYQEVGIVTSLSLIATTIVTFVAGKRGDKGKNKDQIKLGGQTVAATHMLRPLATSGLAVTGLNVVHDVAANVHKVPFLSYYYQHADESNDRLAYVVAMDMSCGLGNSLFWLAFTAGSVLLAEATPLLMTTFVLGGFSALAIPLISRPLTQTAR